MGDFAQWGVGGGGGGANSQRLTVGNGALLKIILLLHVFPLVKENSVTPGSSCQTPCRLSNQLSLAEPKVSKNSESKMD